MGTLNKNILHLEEGPGDSSSSSDEEINTIGNVPTEWYADLPHIGYTRSGTKLLKRNQSGPQPPVYVKNGFYYLYDEKNDEEFALSKQDLRRLVSIVRLQNPSGATESGFVGEEVVFWTGTPRVEPIRNVNVRKRSFLPSRHEATLVIRLVRSILRRQGQKELNSQKTTEADFDIWEQPNSDQVGRRVRHFLPPPKKPLPSHEESYRPPPEFLLNEEEKSKRRENDEFLPETYDFLRHVPVSTALIREHFERCLELYRAPRMRKRRTKIDPETLLPKLPSPETLRPFPDSRIASFGPHSDTILSVSLHSSGQWLASSCQDGSVVIWEIATGVCRVKIDFREKLESMLASFEPTTESRKESTEQHETFPVLHVSWSPKENDFILAACIKQFIIVINLSDILYPGEAQDSQWFGYAATEEETSLDWKEWKDELGRVAIIKHSKRVEHVHWHQKGDYFAVVTKDAFGSFLLVHQLSRKRSQSPFSKSAKGVLTAEFHPFKSLFFIATKHHIRIYDLARAKLVNKLYTGVSEISAMSLHPSGNHVLVGSIEGQLVWFDLDLSSRPYKRVRDHTYTVSSIAFHPTLPLFADASDDETIAIFHATVYEDLLQNPLIVPLKIFKVPCSTKGKLVSVICWHSQLPWLFVSDADGYIRLYGDTS